MNSNRIIVRFWQIDQVVLAKVEAFPDALRGEGLIGKKDVAGYFLSSRESPGLLETNLTLQGTYRERDNVLAIHVYGNSEEAELAIASFSNLIEEWNKQEEPIGHLSLSIKETLAGE